MQYQKEWSYLMKLDSQMLDYIESLYRKEALLLFRYSKVLFDNPSIAEETVQETFIIACLNYKKLIASPNPEGWIMNTHKNVCRNFKKTTNRYLNQMISLDGIPLSSQYTEDVYDDDALASFVTTEDFIILKKIILDGYSHKDLAEELGISIDACKKRFQRAKQRFKKNFNDNQPT